MITTILSLHNNWLFCGDDKASYAGARCSERNFTTVHLPHSNVELPGNYYSEKRTQFVSWYRKHLPTPECPDDTRVFVDFDGVMMVADVYVNGHLACSHRGGYVGFSIDVTPWLHKRTGADNVLAVRVDSHLHPDIPPCGKVMDYQTFGGIYRDVRLRLTPACYLADVFMQTPQALAPDKTLMAAVTVCNCRPTDCHGAAVLELFSLDGRRIASSPTVACQIPARREGAVELILHNLPGIELWELETPQLYRARVTLTEGRHTLDRREERVGFREIEFSQEGPFLLNGKPVKLVGHNRHQTYPYIGAAAPTRLQQRDADILKFELGSTIVRTSHYPQSPHFLERCDEIGLLVFEEAPGWGHIGDATWKDLFCRDVEVMIRRDRNHPSIILWGVRVNESGDDHDLYTRTNQLARALDPTRPTGGVRWGIQSEFLEDVFTSNDYGYAPPAHVINEPPVTPYLITEYGPLIDARQSSSNEMLLHHAMVHADILNATIGHHQVAGAIGWCAFDYHSQDWVTVDGIQPWGVCDLYRAPKFSAFFYASQIDPAVHPVLMAATRWKVGDQAGFDPNENTMKHGHDAPMVVFSNCERIQIFVGDELRGSFTPARDRFPHLAHPPFLCSGLGTVWGPSWQELHIVGLIGDQPVAEQRFPASNEAPNLLMNVDDRTLVADGTDMTRILLRHTDAFGNLQPHSRVVVMLELSGPATLVGPNPCALVGGVTGLYLRAGTIPGKVKLSAFAPELGQTCQAVVQIRKLLANKRTTKNTKDTK